MALTNAEKQRRFCQRRDADAEKRSEYLRKKREKYVSDLAVGKRIHIADMSERAQRQHRKKEKRLYRKKLDNFKSSATLTPPCSPTELEEGINSHQRLTGAKKRNRNIAKCYRDNNKLKQNLEEQKRKAELYKKRWMREKNKSKQSVPIVETPRSKTRRLLKGWKSSSRKNATQTTKNVKRTLVFHNAIIDQIRNKYKKANTGHKKTLSEIWSGQIIQKYKICK